MIAIDKCRKNKFFIAIPHKRFYDCQRSIIITQQQEGDSCFLAENAAAVIKLTKLSIVNYLRA